MYDTSNTIISQVLWYEITNPVDRMPDDEVEVLVYDGYTDLVMIGFVETDEGDDYTWIDAATQLPIKNPQWWADMPCPVDSPSFPF